MVIKKKLGSGKLGEMEKTSEECSSGQIKTKEVEKFG